MPATLSDWEQAALAVVRDYCGWAPAPSRRETLVVTALERSRDLSIPSGHVTEVHSVKVRAPGQPWTVLPEHLFEWDFNGLLRLPRGHLWPQTLRGVEVDVTHGFEWDEVPNVAGVVHNLARRAASGVYGVASQSVTGASVSYQTAGGAPLSIPLLQIEKQTLDPYRITAGDIPG